MKSKILVALSLFLTLVELEIHAQYNVLVENFATASIENESNINQENLEFSPFFYRDFIGFVYSNPKSGRDQEISEYYFDLGFSARGIDGELLKRAAFNKNINSEFHEGPACFDDKKGILYFTRTYYDPSKVTKRDTIVRKIYQANERNDFENQKVLGISSDKYSTCHPTLNESGNELFFASNQELSLGGMDLFVSKSKTGLWDNTKSLPSINSSFNEIFPFVFKDDVLFFASDRPDGLGGLDIYVSSRVDTTWSEPQLLPYPINSSYDDFGLILRKDGKTGYFTSSRPGGTGKDDLYSFSTQQSVFEKLKIAPLIPTSITLLDKLTLAPQANIAVFVSKISLKNNKYNLEDFEIDVLAGEQSGEILMKLSPKPGASVDTLYSDSKGSISLELPEDQKYLIRTISEDYEEQFIVYNPMKDDPEINIILNPIPKVTTPIEEKQPEIIIPTSVGEIVVFNNIYYETNSAKILLGAARELDILAKAMLENAEMKIELSSHTDSRGTNSYNQELSLRRAIAAKEYLEGKGINGGRIKAIGLGESKIRNHCANNVKCSEEEHQYNRRTEVKILN